MDIEGSFQLINAYIRDDKINNVRPTVDLIVSECDNDPVVLIKCVSILRVVDEEEAASEILDLLCTLIPKDGTERFSVTQALRGLGRYEESYNSYKTMDQTDAVIREEILALRGMDEFEEAYSLTKKIQEPTISDDLMEAKVLCDLGEFTKALELSKKLVSEDRDYKTLVGLCDTLILMGNMNEALKISKNYMKEAKNADGFALAARTLRICGKVPAAANYANRAVTLDYTHKGAVETLALCLIEKGRIKEAKVLAGGINQLDPGCEEVLNIMDSCRSAML